MLDIINRQREREAKEKKKPTGQKLNRMSEDTIRKVKAKLKEREELKDSVKITYQQIADACEVPLHSVQSIAYGNTGAKVN